MLFKQYFIIFWYIVLPIFIEIKLFSVPVWKSVLILPAVINTAPDEGM